MAKYFVPCDSFADVEKLYNETKPIRKRDHKLRKLNRFTDLRPTNDRGRQWESIRKITKNKYALHDNDNIYAFFWGDFTLDTISFDEYLKIYEDTAPIVWERKRDGTEVLTVRNLSQWYYYTNLPTSRVGFLDRHLPRGWSVISDRGHQFLKCGTPCYNPKNVNALGTYVLPRNTFLPKSLMKFKENDSHRRNFSNRVQRYEDKCLRFVRNKDNTWQEPKKIYGELRWRVAIDKKKKENAVFKEFANTALPIMSMLEGDFRDLDRDSDVRDTLDYIKNNIGTNTRITPIGFTYMSFNRSEDNRVIPLVRQQVKDIMCDQDHEHYIGLVKLIKASLLYNAGYRDNFDIQARYNTWVNRFFGFLRKVEVRP